MGTAWCGWGLGLHTRSFSEMASTCLTIPMAGGRLEVAAGVWRHIYRSLRAPLGRCTAWHQRHIWLAVWNGRFGMTVWQYGRLA